MNQESPTRQALGCAAIIGSILFGIYMDSFLYGLGAFLAVNLILAPIISFIEKSNQ